MPLRIWKSGRASGKYFKADQREVIFQNSPASFLEK
jgi:hypothetical protein